MCMVKDLAQVIMGMAFPEGVKRGHWVLDKAEADVLREAGYAARYPNLGGRHAIVYRGVVYGIHVDRYSGVAAREVADIEVMYFGNVKHFNIQEVAA